MSINVPHSSFPIIYHGCNVKLYLYHNVNVRLHPFAGQTQLHMFRPPYYTLNPKNLMKRPKHSLHNPCAGYYTSYVRVVSYGSGLLKPSSHQRLLRSQDNILHSTGHSGVSVSAKGPWDLGDVFLHFGNTQEYFRLHPEVASPEPQRTLNMSSSSPELIVPP